MSSKTANARRIRESLKVLREYAGIPSNRRIEVGARNKPVIRETRPTCKEDLWWDDFNDDNVFDCYRGTDYATRYTEGEVLHFYIYWGDDLTNIATVWSGFGDEKPVVANWGGKWVGGDA